MKQLVLLFSLLLGVMLFTWWSSKPGNLALLFDRLDLFSTPEGQQTVTREEKKYIQIGGNRFEVILARTQKERKDGLSKYDRLPDGTAMLFVFDSEDVRTAFWMKGMKFPIDIIWVNDGKVSQIKSNVPVPEEGTPDSAIPYYVSDDTFDYVVEVNAGVAKASSIEKGGSVILPSF